jgi:hypothetical protein
MYRPLDVLALAYLVHKADCIKRYPSQFRQRAVQLAWEL